MLLLGGLAMSGGGYDLFSRHLAGIAAWILTGVMLVGPWPERVRPGRSLAVIGGLILALALVSGVSSIWSSSVPSSLSEFERNVGYLGFFTAGYLTCRTPKQRESFTRGIGAGLGLIIVAALVERLMPGATVDTELGVNRLNYPLGYWNADGIAFGCALALFVWFAVNTSSGRWRRTLVAGATLAAPCVYLTYSRGGLLVATVSLVLLLFLSNQRLKILGITLIVIAATVPILVVINQFPEISGADKSDPSVGQSLIVLLVILVVTALAVVLLEVLERAARSRPERLDRALAVSRDRRNLLWVAGIMATLFLAVVVVFGASAWDQFSDSDVPALDATNQRFTELSGSWRYEFSQVAIDTFRQNPVLGTGAGTYPIQWDREREVPVFTDDAHSFYLENLSDLGIIGGLLTLGLAIALIWLAVRAWRRGADLDAPAVLAVTVALLIAFGFDWFWRLGATAALLLLLAAWIASAGPRTGDAPEEKSLGPGVKAGGLLVAWLAIIVLAVPAAADRYVDASANSVRAGNIGKAIDQARTASSLAPWLPDPHMQLATIADSRGERAEAMRQVNKAIDLDPENWRALVLRFRFNFADGDRRKARRDFMRLRQINPLTFRAFRLSMVGDSSQ
ncbi:MAG: O-antigen ligase family protein [Solirubrobacterales bacterium]|nr:O-antigen ligase family protein [Solirubrobacterales bacterium]MCB8915458.1 O-antigen ligase family protein [Thermoleophilales bacterium]